jgi:hypothetical protein
MAIAGEPFGFLQSFLFRFPTFVGVHAYRFGGCDFAQRREDGLLVGHTDLEFQNRVSFRRQNFLADDFGFINADAEGSHVVVFAETKPEKIVERFAGPLRCAIQQGDIQRALGGHIAGGDGVEIFHAAGHVRKR